VARLEAGLAFVALLAMGACMPSTFMPSPSPSTQVVAHLEGSSGITTRVVHLAAGDYEIRSEVHTNGRPKCRFAASVKAPIVGYSFDLGEQVITGARGSSSGRDALLDAPDADFQLNIISDCEWRIDIARS
jgi:hypothetical protein